MLASEQTKHNILRSNLQNFFDAFMRIKKFKLKNGGLPFGGLELGDTKIIF